MILNKKTALALLAVAILIVLISVLNANQTNSAKETFLVQYNLPQLDPGNPFSEQNVTLPPGTKSVRVEYQNISVEPNRTPNNAILKVYYLNAVPDFSVGINITEFKENHFLHGNIVYLDSKSQKLSGNLTYTDDKLMALIIRDDNLKAGGIIKIYIKK